MEYKIEDGYICIPLNMEINEAKKILEEKLINNSYVELTTDVYDLETCLGSLTENSSIVFKNILNDLEYNEFNKIGYTGKNSNGEKTTICEFLNSINKGNFVVQKTKIDNGDFIEKYTIIRTFERTKKSLKDVIDQHVMYFDGYSKWVDFVSDKFDEFEKDEVIQEQETILYNFLYGYYGIKTNDDDIKNLMNLYAKSINYEDWSSLIEYICNENDLDLFEETEEDFYIFIIKRYTNF